MIIVLSGEQGERVVTGVKLYQEGLAPRLLMTGGLVERNVAAAGGFPVSQQPEKP